MMMKWQSVSAAPLKVSTLLTPNAVQLIVKVWPAAPAVLLVVARTELSKLSTVSELKTTPAL